MRTLLGSYAVSFGVEETADLSQIAIALYLIIDEWRFHQIGIVFIEYIIDAFLVGLYKRDLGIRLHCLPHALISVDPRVLFIFKTSK